MDSEKCQVIDSEQVTLIAERSGWKTRGGNMKVHFAMLLKTNVGKMSEMILSTMLMKTSELMPPLHDLIEKNGVSVIARERMSVGWQAAAKELKRRDKRSPAVLGQSIKPGELISPLQVQTETQPNSSLSCAHKSAGV